MKAVVVYESMFGNTERVAKAIAAGMADGVEAVAVEVSTLPNVEDAQLVVVGGPTHAFSMSRETTRSDARSRGRGAVVSQTGIREWIASAVLPRAGLVATFDTRIRRPRLPGSAAKAAMKHLRRAGATPLTAPTSFWVDGTTGPLLDGELDRARAWGQELATALLAERRAIVEPR